MDEMWFQVWLGLGLFCVIAELLLPGLVVIFIGLGAFSVALGMHFNYLQNFSSQLITFFISSIIYIFTLRLLILRFFPTNRVKANVNEDENVLGQVVEVVDTISAGKPGRILHSDSTWKAKSNGVEEILKGEQVKIVGRDNITWIVEKL